ncbi:unnamed protein product [Pedinophyceae sp. YPF-701]|nr:unnamed protein product [Pedinophyceae sp. YPF-701]
MTAATAVSIELPVEEDAVRAAVQELLVAATGQDDAVALKALLEKAVERATVPRKGPGRRSASRSSMYRAEQREVRAYLGGLLASLNPAAASLVEARRSSDEEQAQAEGAAWAQGVSGYEASLSGEPERGREGADGGPAGAASGRRRASEPGVQAKHTRTPSLGTWTEGADDDLERVRGDAPNAQDRSRGHVEQRGPDAAALFRMQPGAALPPSSVDGIRAALAQSDQRAAGGAGEAARSTGGAQAPAAGRGSGAQATGRRPGAADKEEELQAFEFKPFLPPDDAKQQSRGDGAGTDADEAEDDSVVVVTGGELRARVQRGPAAEDASAAPLEPTPLPQPSRPGPGIDASREPDGAGDVAEGTQTDDTDTDTGRAPQLAGAGRSGPDTGAAVTAAAKDFAQAMAQLREFASSLAEATQTVATASAREVLAARDAAAERAANDRAKASSVRSQPSEPAAAALPPPHAPSRGASTSRHAPRGALRSSHGPSAAESMRGSRAAASLRASVEPEASLRSATTSRRVSLAPTPVTEPAAVLPAPAEAAAGTAERLAAPLPAPLATAVDRTMRAVAGLTAAAPPARHGWLPEAAEDPEAPHVRAVQAVADATGGEFRYWMARSELEVLSQLSKEITAVTGGGVLDQGAAEEPEDVEGDEDAQYMSQVRREVEARIAAVAGEVSAMSGGRGGKGAVARGAAGRAVRAAVPVRGAKAGAGVAAAAAPPGAVERPAVQSRLAKTIGKAPSAATATDALARPATATPRAPGGGSAAPPRPATAGAADDARAKRPSVKMSVRGVFPRPAEPTVPPPLQPKRESAAQRAVQRAADPDAPSKRKVKPTIAFGSRAEALLPRPGERSLWKTGAGKGTWLPSVGRFVKPKYSRRRPERPTDPPPARALKPIRTTVAATARVQRPQRDPLQPPQPLAALLKTTGQQIGVPSGPMVPNLTRSRATHVADNVPTTTTPPPPSADAMRDLLGALLQQVQARAADIAPPQQPPPPPRAPQQQTAPPPAPPAPPAPPPEPERPAAETQMSSPEPQQPAPPERPPAAHDRAVSPLPSPQPPSSRSSLQSLTDALTDAVLERVLAGTRAPGEPPARSDVDNLRGLATQALVGELSRMGSDSPPEAGPGEDGLEEALVKLVEGELARMADEPGRGEFGQQTETHLPASGPAAAAADATLPARSPPPARAHAPADDVPEGPAPRAPVLVLGMPRGGLSRDTPLPPAAAPRPAPVLGPAPPGAVPDALKDVIDGIQRRLRAVQTALDASPEPSPASSADAPPPRRRGPETPPSPQSPVRSSYERFLVVEERTTERQRDTEAETARAPPPPPQEPAPAPAAPEPAPFEARVQASIRALRDSAQDELPEHPPAPPPPPPGPDLGRISDPDWLPAGLPRHRLWRPREGTPSEASPAGTSAFYASRGSDAPGASDMTPPGSGSGLTVTATTSSGSDSFERAVREELELLAGGMRRRKPAEINITQAIGVDAEGGGGAPGAPGLRRQSSSIGRGPGSDAPRSFAPRRPFGPSGGSFEAGPESGPDSSGSGLGDMQESMSRTRGARAWQDVQVEEGSAEDVAWGPTVAAAFETVEQGSLTSSGGLSSGSSAVPPADVGGLERDEDMPPSGYFGFRPVRMGGRRGGE